MRRLQICLSLFLITTCLGQSGNVNLGPLPGMQFVNRTHRLGRGLVAYYPMNERSGPTVFDLSGNGLTGTFQGTAPSWTAGKFGSAVLLPGTNEYISTPTISFSGPFTLIGWWFNRDNAKTAMMYSTSVSTAKIGTVSSKFFVRIVSNSNNLFDLPSQDAWHYIVITRDLENKVDLYVDDSAVIRLFFNAAQSGTFTLDEIGGDPTDGQYMDGLLDNLMIYNRALSAGEVAEIYKEKDSWMFKHGNIELMAKSAEAPPTGGQVIMIQMSAIPLIFIVGLCLTLGRKNGQEVS